MISKSPQQIFEEWQWLRFGIPEGIRLLAPTTPIAAPLEPEPPDFMSYFFELPPGRNNSRTFVRRELNQEKLESKLESSKNREKASDWAERKLNTMYGIKASEDVSLSFLNDQNSPVSKIIKSATTKVSFETTVSTLPLLANKAKADATVPVISCSKDLSLWVFTDFLKVAAVNPHFSPAPNRWAADVWRPP